MDYDSITIEPNDKGYLVIFWFNGGDEGIEVQCRTKVGVRGALRGVRNRRRIPVQWLRA